jgi:hypothetical protein
VFTVSGSGVDGEGANRQQLVRPAAECVRTDRAGRGRGRSAERRTGACGNSSPTLTLNGHALTKAGTNAVEFYNLTVYSGGRSDGRRERHARLLYGTLLQRQRNQYADGPRRCTLLELYQSRKTTRPFGG